MTILKERFKLLTTIIISAVVYVLSLGLSGLVKSFFENARGGNMASVLVGALLMFVASIFIYKNNVFQKIYLTVLSISNFAYFMLFTELTLGIFPFKTAGAFAGIYSVIIYILITLLSGMLIYRVFKYYADSDISIFIVGITLIQIMAAMIAYGFLDFLFPNSPHSGRLLLSTLFYIFIFFAHRSQYHAAKYVDRKLEAENYEKFLGSEASRFSDTLTYIQSTRAVKNSYDSALDSITTMKQNGDGNKIPQYIAGIKRNSAKNASLEVYCENPYVSSVIAMNAMRAQQMGISFMSHANIAGKAMRPSEICVIADEMINNALDISSQSSENPTVHFTIVPTNEALTFESAFSSAGIPEKEKFSFSGKSMADILAYLFEDRDESENYPGLENTQDIIKRYSGRISHANTDGGVIMTVTINC